MKTLRLDPCIPAVWAQGGHKQTLLGHFWPSQKLAHKGQLLQIKLPDGDQLIGHVLKGTSKTVIYLFHGLAGSSDSGYIRRAALLAQRMGHSVIMMNHRGCGEGAGLAKRPYHSGSAEDLSAALDEGRRIFPDHRHITIGFSLSANAILVLLTGLRGSTLPDAAITFNGPIHLESASVLLRKGLNRIYDLDFLRRCKDGAFQATGKKVRLPLWSTLHAFDQIYTAPAAGFQSREEYYHSCSTWSHLDKIKTPTIIFSAKDDPFISAEHYLQAKTSTSVQLHLEEYGGHLGYLTRHPTKLGNKRWMDYALSEAIQSVTSK